MASRKLPTQLPTVNFHGFVSPPAIFSSISSATDLHLSNGPIKFLSVCSIADAINTHRNHRLCRGGYFFAGRTIGHGSSVSISTFNPTTY